MSDFIRGLLALPRPASTVAGEVDALHFFVIGITMLGAVGVAVTAIVFVTRYRRGKGATRKIWAPLWLEGIFIGGLLALFLLWWVIGFRQYVRLQVPPKEAMDVYVTGKQWMWKFAYPSGQNAVSVLTVPVNRPVRLVMTSRDVIHSFSIPAFRVKQDVLPGQYTTLWFEATETGSYQVLCTEYCGTSHSNMWGRVDVLSAEDYEAWLDGRDPLIHQRAVDEMTAARPIGIPPEAEEIERGMLASRGERLAVRGRAVAVRHACFACHSVDGRQHIGPTFAGLYGKERELLNGEVVVADADYLTESMMDPMAKIAAGYGPIMPTFQGLLSAGETAALVELIKSLQHVSQQDLGVPGRSTTSETVPWPVGNGEGEEEGAEGQGGAEEGAAEGQGAAEEGAGREGAGGGDAEGAAGGEGAGEEGRDQ